MEFDLNADQKDIREVARALLEQRVSPGRIRECAESGRDDSELWRELCELGWPGIAIPEEHGGQGLGLVELCVLLEEQGAALAATPLLPSVCAAQLILRAGTEAQRERWLPALASGAAQGAIGFGGADETFVAGAVDADVIVIPHPGGASLVGGDQVRVTPAATIDLLRSYGWVEGPREALPEDVPRGVDEITVAVAAEQVGVARHALEASVAYVKERRQFDTPVGSFQAVGHRCAQMFLDVESARSVVYHAAWAADADPDRLPEAAALAKYVSSRAVVDVTGSAIQAHGGVGFSWEADVHWWYKRAQLTAPLLGGPDAHRERLGAMVAERAAVADERG